MEKAVAYIRVSTAEQAKEGVSLEVQAKKAAAYADLNDLELVETFADEGISAKSIKGRAGLQAALAALQSGESRHLIVFKLDRLARNTVETLEMAEQMKSWGAVLHSISEKLDTDSAIGKFFFTLIASLAEMERNIIAERTPGRDGQQKGKRGARIPPCPPRAHLRGQERGGGLQRGGRRRQGPSSCAPPVRPSGPSAASLRLRAISTAMAILTMRV